MDDWKQVKLSLEKPYDEPVLYDITPQGEHVYETSVHQLCYLQVLKILAAKKVLQRSWAKIFGAYFSSVDTTFLTDTMTR